MLFGRFLDRPSSYILGLRSGRRIKKIRKDENTRISEDFADDKRDLINRLLNFTKLKDLICALLAAYAS